MGISPEEFEKLLVRFEEMFRQIVKEERASFWVEPEQHYKDHLLIQNCEANKDEMRANHEFVMDARKALASTTKQVRTITVRVGYGGLLVLIGYAIYHYVKEQFKS